jgi:Putative hemolysin
MDGRLGAARSLATKVAPLMRGTAAALKLPGARPLAPEIARLRSLGRIGSLEARLATSAADVATAQRLRYEVFYEEMAAIADARTLASRRDVDAFDAICDHLLVIDHDAAAAPRPLARRKAPVVGTYRLLRQTVADLHDGFYTAGEFDVEPMLERHRALNFLELGRSCVLPPYRNKRTVELLWAGIWSYVRAHRIDVMFGCASFEGTDPERLALPLSFLAHNAAPPAEWQVSALPGRRVEMKRMEKEAIDTKAALAQLPPLIKGYLRLGAYIGDGAVVDHQFGTTDVLVVLPVAAINPRYVTYYGPEGERRAG